ncbi:hypothetical protein UA44_25360 [Klebsiella aerogenes]|nr:hypothetical protein UA44_25360 [Klebsiella aerogenes]
MNNCSAASFDRRGCVSGWKRRARADYFRANQALFAQLRQTTPSVFWRQVDGGHDALCWRGGLTSGLIQLWQPLRRGQQHALNEE